MLSRMRMYAGAIQSPAKKKSRKSRRAPQAESSVDVPASNSNTDAAGGLAKDASEVWDPCTAAREECGQFGEAEAGSFDSVSRYAGPQWQAGGACTSPRDLLPVPHSPRVALQEGQVSSLYERSSQTSSSSASAASLSPRGHPGRGGTVGGVHSAAVALSPRSPRGGGSDAGALQRPLSSRKLKGLGQEKEWQKWGHHSGGKPGNMKVPRLALGSVRRVEEDPACISSGRQAPTCSVLPATRAEENSARRDANAKAKAPKLKLEGSVDHMADHIRYVADVNELQAAGGSSVEDCLPALVATETSKEFWDQMIPETSRSLELESEAVSTGGTGTGEGRQSSVGVDAGRSSSGDPGPVEGGGGQEEGQDRGEDNGSSDEGSLKSAAEVMGCTTPELATVSAIKKSALTLFGGQRNNSSVGAVASLLHRRFSLQCAWMHAWCHCSPCRLVLQHRMH